VVVAPNWHFCAACNRQSVVTGDRATDHDGAPRRLNQRQPRPGMDLLTALMTVHSVIHIRVGARRRCGHGFGTRRTAAPRTWWSGVRGGQRGL